LSYTISQKRNHNNCSRLRPPIVNTKFKQSNSFISSLNDNVSWESVVPVIGEQAFWYVCILVERNPTQSMDCSRLAGTGTSCSLPPWLFCQGCHAHHGRCKPSSLPATRLRDGSYLSITPRDLIPNGSTLLEVDSF
jgi:hypothetical protein